MINKFLEKLRVIRMVLLGYGIVYNVHLAINGEFAFVDNKRSKKLFVSTSLFEGIESNEQAQNLNVILHRATIRYIADLEWQKPPIFTGKESAQP